MQEALLTRSTCTRNFSQDQHARGTSHRINMKEELLTGSTCTRNFSQDQHARGTSHRIRNEEDCFTGLTCKRNFSQDQHAIGTSHRIKMREELLICLWLFYLRYQIILPTVTITYTSAVNLSFFPPL